MRRFMLGGIIIVFCLSAGAHLREKAFAEDVSLSGFFAAYEPIDTTFISPNIPDYSLPLD